MQKIWNWVKDDAGPITATLAILGTFAAIVQFSVVRPTQQRIDAVEQLSTPETDASTPSPSSCRPPTHPRPRIESGAGSESAGRIRRCVGRMTPAANPTYIIHIIVFRPSHFIACTPRRLPLICPKFEFRHWLATASRLTHTIPYSWITGLVIASRLRYR